MRPQITTAANAMTTMCMPITLTSPRRTWRPMAPTKMSTPIAAGGSERWRPDPGSAVTLPNEDLVAEAVRFTRSFQRLLTRGGGSSLSYDRARILETLHCNGPQRMRDIADQVDLPARNLTAVADSLEMEHLVRRTPHPTDRRATLLEVTDAGRSAIENAQRVPSRPLRFRGDLQCSGL